MLTNHNSGQQSQEFSVKDNPTNEIESILQEIERRELKISEFDPYQDTNDPNKSIEEQEKIIQIELRAIGSLEARLKLITFGDEPVLKELKRCLGNDIGLLCFNYIMSYKWCGFCKTWRYTSISSSSNNNNDNNNNDKIVDEAHVDDNTNDTIEHEAFCIKCCFSWSASWFHYTFNNPITIQDYTGIMQKCSEKKSNRLTRKQIHLEEESKLGYHDLDFLIDFGEYKSENKTIIVHLNDQTVRYLSHGPTTHFDSFRGVLIVGLELDCKVHQFIEDQLYYEDYCYRSGWYL